MKQFNLLTNIIREIAKTSTTDQIIINGSLLDAEDLANFRMTYGVDLNPGAYWYDSRSGQFGRQGEAFLGALNPGHKFGHLSSDASTGTSGVFINGRELQKTEAQQLSRLFCYHRTVTGRYWVNANGDMGDEGYPFVTGNIYLAIAIAQKHQTSSVHNFWTKRLSSENNYFSRAAS